MAAAVACAVYTRKSSEEGLEQGFNSLDAQREACLAFIQSQKSLGWRPLPDRFDDGGFSGGNMERPGLQSLMAAVDAGRVQIIVVYKVDRLTRSLADFAKLVERFDAQGVSFVSVTQAFNTTTSMGRLTLNVLLSFAQFEREVTGERIRDKIAASKRKGMWMGGIPPMGYRPHDRTLQVDEPEAERVREIFRLYLDLGCVSRLKRELDARGWLTPIRRTQRLDQVGGRSFSRGHLHGILTNAIYLGKINHRGTLHDGNHPAIVDSTVWEAVQAQLKANTQGKRPARHGASVNHLLGLLRDDRGRTFTATHARKGARKYRYYVLAGVDQEPDLRLAAGDLEEIVLRAVTDVLQDDSRLAHHLGTSDAVQLSNRIRAAGTLASNLEAAPRDVLPRILRSVVVGGGELRIEINTSCLDGKLDQTEDAGECDGQSPAMIVETLPFEVRRCGMAVRMIVPGQAAAGKSGERNAPLIALISRALDWYERLDSGAIESVRALAMAENKVTSYVSRVIQLAFLAPDIIEAVALGTQPPELTADRLLRSVPLPANWQSQRDLLGIR